jgi:hypothetical protein
MTSCGLIHGCQRFGGTCFHLQGMEMGAAYSPKTMVPTYNIKQYHSPEDCNLCGTVVEQLLVKKLPKIVSPGNGQDSLHLLPIFLNSNVL